MRRRLVGAGVGLLADRLVGDPPDRAHPVAWFGSAMGRLEEVLWADRRDRGAAHLAAGVVAAAAAGRAVRSTAGAVCLASAGRQLGAEARAVAGLLERGDLDGARRRLPALAGRDPSGLDAGEVARAVVESVAENTTDAVVAPALWGALAGARGALVHRAVNTLDAMVGHRDDRYRRFGWASARADDAMAFVPARVTALLVAAVRPTAAGAVWRAVRHDAPAHPSPNAGVGEAAFAAALGLRLGGANRYGDEVELRPPLGDGRPPAAGDVDAAVRLLDDVTLALAGLLVLAGLAW